MRDLGAESGRCHFGTLPRLAVLYGVDEDTLVAAAGRSQQMWRERLRAEAAAAVVNPCPKARRRV
jgi:hypothetical protein